MRRQGYGSLLVCLSVCLSVHNFLHFFVIATSIKFYLQLVTVVCYHFKFYKEIHQQQAFKKLLGKKYSVKKISC